jgi:hypothetical protein
MADLLNTITAWFAKYVYVVNPDDYDKLALWAVHTWLCHETYTSPRLLLDSPVPGSGKTTVLEHLDRLCWKPVRMASAGTPALIARLLNVETRTILLDEADRTLDPKNDGVGDLLAVLNSGYKVGATRPVLEPGGKDKGWQVLEMPTYAPVAIAGNTPKLPDDTKSRCIVIRLLPDRNGHIEESDWELIEPQAKELHERIAEQVELVRDQIRTDRPTLPPGCKNRDKERWNPLKRVAALAGAEWSSRVDRIIVVDMEQVKQERESGAGMMKPAVVLVQDLQTLFGETYAFLATSYLVRELVRLNPEHWGSGNQQTGRDLTPQGFGRMLSTSYGITSTRQGDSPRGYLRAQFVKAWESLGRVPDEPTRPTEPTEPTA